MWLEAACCIEEVARIAVWQGSGGQMLGWGDYIKGTDKGQRSGAHDKICVWGKYFWHMYQW